jgi:hypothetical protein
VLGEHREHPLQRAVSNPRLEAAVAGLVRWVVIGQVAPRGAGSEQPEDAVEHLPWVPPGAPSPIRSTRRLEDKRFQGFPLLAGKIHVHPR